MKGYNIKKIIVYTAVVLFGLSGVAISQSKGPGTKISTSILINKASFSGSKLSFGLEGVYNFNKKMSIVFNYFSLTTTSSVDPFTTGILSQKYFSIGSRINLINNKVKFFFETGPVLSFSKQTFEGASSLITSYSYRSEGNTKISGGINLGVGTEIKLSSDFSTILKGNRLFIFNNKNVTNLSVGIKCNFK